MIKWLQSLPAWDGDLVFIVLVCSVLFTVAVFTLVILCKLGQIQELKEKLSEYKIKLLNAEDSLKQSQHDYEILSELYHFEIAKNAHLKK